MKNSPRAGGTDHLRQHFLTYFRHGFRSPHDLFRAIFNSVNAVRPMAVVHALWLDCRDAFLTRKSPAFSRAMVATFPRWKNYISLIRPF